MTRSAGPVSAAESLMWRLRADLARTTGYVRLCPNSDIDRYDHLPEAGASMKRQAFLSDARQVIISMRVYYAGHADQSG
jgi:hypothetical protein